MSVRVAKSAGFCFGVSRAVELVEQAAKAGKKVVTLGPIIHNHHVVDKFRALGVEVIDAPEQACPGQTVIIRSHGVSRAVYEELQRRGVEIIDATCPFVKRIHGIVSRAEEEGQLPVIIGTPTHPEVEGIAGWCRDCRVFETLDDLKNWAYSKENLKNSSICMVSQTTLTESLWKMCGEFAKKQFTNLKIFDTICRATEYRQSEAAELSEICQSSSSSFLRAASSICIWMILRLMTSSSVGMESISVRIIAQASSMRSMALSGRKRSVI